MKIEGKKIWFLGDSITEGCCASPIEKCYVGLFAEFNPTATVKNYGVGGTRIAKNKEISKEYPQWDRDFILRAEEMEEGADVVCVFGGTNDFGHGDAPIGKFGDSDPYTFYGALKTLILLLIKKYPTAKIVFFTPLHRADIPETQAVKAPDKQPLQRYVDAIREMAEYYSLPVLDLWATSGMNPIVDEIATNYFTDRLHPNNAGHYRLYEMVEQFIKNL